MMIEVEVKLHISDRDNIVEKLSKHGFSRTEYIMETDTYFNNAADFIRVNGYALRIRKTKNCISGEEYSQINLKGKKLDNVSMSREELETEVKDGDVLKDILEMLEYHPVEPVMIKTREMYTKDDVTICIDKVKDLGDFMEIEILVDEEAQKDSALDRVYDIIGMLGCEQSQTTRRSYLSMLQEKGRK